MLWKLQIAKYIYKIKIKIVGAEMEEEEEGKILTSHESERIRVVIVVQSAVKRLSFWELILYPQQQVVIIILY